jgi:hypothetical protein
MVERHRRRVCAIPPFRDIATKRNAANSNGATTIGRFFCGKWAALRVGSWVEFSGTDAGARVRRFHNPRMARRTGFSRGARRELPCCRASELVGNVVRVKPQST